MVILTILLCIVLLVLLITWAKVTPFLAFLIVSIIAGLMLGIPLGKINASVGKGLGETLSSSSGSLVVIICLGAMLGKLIAHSGAAQKIADVLVNAVGEKHIQWALVVAGFVIGLPLFYGIGFVLVVPLIFSIVYKYKLPAVYIGLPMLASLSVTHGFLPPHPSPSALVVLFHANMGLTLIYGIIVAIPAIVIAGPLYAKTLRGIQSTPLTTFVADVIPDEQLPGGFNSFFTALLPVILLMATTLFLAIYPGKGELQTLIGFIGDPSVVMIIAVIVAMFTLGISQNTSLAKIGQLYADAIKDIALILLIIGGSGAFKQVLTDSGASNTIAAMLQTLSLSPLILGWLIAAIIRFSLGSATVAGLTAAGIIASLMVHTHTNPNLMVLSIGAGSLAFSHVNDGGFWMFKEYFNVSIKDTLRSWSVMETLVSVIGLGGVLVLNLFVK